MNARRPMGVWKTIDAIINPGDGLLYWAWNQGKRGLPLKDTRERKAGLDVHALAELLAKGGRPQLDELPPDQRPPAAALLDWWDRVQPRVLASEMSLRSTALDLSGRIDLVTACAGCPLCCTRWRCPTCKTDLTGMDWTDHQMTPPVCEHPPPHEPALFDPDAELSPDGGTWDYCEPDPGAWPVDFKVVKRTARIKEKWHFQTGTAYRALYDEDALANGRALTCGAAIVLLPHDGPPARVIRSVGHPDDALHMTGWARALERVREQIDQERRNR